jgi:hypothetical protein
MIFRRVDRASISQSILREPRHYFECDCPKALKHARMALWPGSVIGLTRRPLKAETTGSIPVRATKSSPTPVFLRVPPKACSYGACRSLGPVLLLALAAQREFDRWRISHRANAAERYLLGAVAAECSSRRNGLIEKNLWRQGSQRSAGSPKRRPTFAVTPGTCSAEMRCNSRLPQIPQCAYKNVRNGISRA